MAAMLDSQRPNGDSDITRELLDQYATDIPQAVKMYNTDYYVTGSKDGDIYTITAYTDDRSTRNTVTCVYKMTKQGAELIGDKKRTKTANFNVPEVYSKYQEQMPAHNAYMTGRGISNETCRKYNVVYAPNYEWTTGAGKVIKINAVLLNYSEVYGYTVRAATDSGYFWDKCKVLKEGCAHNWMPENIFNIDKKPVIITEGECDFLSLAEVGYDNIICLSSTSGHTELKEYIEKNRDKLESKPFKYPVIINLDSDASGDETAAALKESLDNLQLFREVYVTTALNGDCNDINAYLQKDRKGLKKALADTLNNCFEIKSNAAFDFDALIGKSSAPIKTGSPQLDLVLDGGFIDGLYTIGGNTGAGKTTYALQLADNIAKANNNVLYIALEMSRTELRARSISRITSEIATASGSDYMLRDGCTSRQILDTVKYNKLTDKDKQLINQANELYKKYYAKNMFVYEGVGDIDIEKIRDAIHYFKQRSDIEGKGFIVFVDYLQMIAAPTNRSTTDKQQTDIAVKGLKKASRDDCVPVVLLSSINRDSYDSEMSLKSFKASGDIEFTSSVCLVLQAKQKSEYVKSYKLRNMTRDIRKELTGATAEPSEDMYEYEPKYTILEEQCPLFGEQPARSITLSALKQREGKNQGAAYYKYCAMFNRFIDDTDAARDGHLINLDNINNKTLDSVFRESNKQNKVPFVYMRDTLELSDAQLRQLIENSDYYIGHDINGNEVIKPKAGQQTL